MFEDYKQTSSPIELGGPGSKTYVRVDWESTIEQDVIVGVHELGRSLAYFSQSIPSTTGPNSITFMLDSMPYPVQIVLESPFPIHGFVVTTRTHELTLNEAGLSESRWSHPVMYTVGDVSNALVEKVRKVYPILGRKLRM